MSEGEYRNILAEYYKDYGFDRIREFDGQTYYLCYYCENLATGRDHVPPLSILRDLLLNDKTELIWKLERLTVPCCKGCNLRLGARALLTVEDRKAFIFSNPAPREPQYSKGHINRKINPDRLSLTGVINEIRKIADYYRNNSSREKYNNLYRELLRILKTYDIALDQEIRKSATETLIEFREDELTVNQKFVLRMRRLRGEI